MMSAAIRFFALTAVIGAAWLTWAHADEPSIHRIGVIDREGSPEGGLRGGLRELGYIEGKNITIDWRRVSDQTPESLHSIVTELARSHIEVIVAFSTPAARVALKETSLPVVFVAGDPVGSGLAESLARPGGQGTGVSMLNRELAGKRIELLRQLVPGARRVDFLINPWNPLDVRMLEETESAARTLGVELTVLRAGSSAELDARLRAISRSSANGLVVSNDLLFLAERAKITQAVRKTRLPAIFPFKEYHQSGALISYGPSALEGTRKAATYVVKILEGAKPADLPIEQISDFELVIDLRVAREQGIKVPEGLLYRANEVVR